MGGKSIVTLFLVVLLLAACAQPRYKDGIYSGRSAEDDTGAWGEVTIAIADGAVSACDFITREKDGTIKGEDYGKINGVIASQDYYDKAQLAVRAMEQYAREYVEKQRLKDIDAVSGATIAYDQFNEAVGYALEQARQ
jgi:major membrane immunogen (membrane-anchored lipoprotein)